MNHDCPWPSYFFPPTTYCFFCTSIRLLGFLVALCTVMTGAKTALGSNDPCSILARLDNAIMDDVVDDCAVRVYRR